jgi:sodium pump decarboxylase gamma subunit
MFAGVGTVFVLLVSLVWVVRAMSTLCRWLEPAAVLAPAQSPALPSSPNDEELSSVIGAAVEAHRRKSRTSPRQ